MNSPLIRPVWTKFRPDRKRRAVGVIGTLSLNSAPSFLDTALDGSTSNHVEMTSVECVNRERSRLREIAPVGLRHGKSTSSIRSSSVKTGESLKHRNRDASIICASFQRDCA